MQCKPGETKMELKVEIIADMQTLNLIANQLESNARTIFYAPGDIDKHKVSKCLDRVVKQIKEQTKPINQKIFLNIY
jgi:hypothetical protein